MPCREPAKGCECESFFDQVCEGQVIYNLIEIDVGALDENFSHQPLVFVARLARFRREIDMLLIELNSYWLQAREILRLNVERDRGLQFKTLLPSGCVRAGRRCSERS